MFISVVPFSMYLHEHNIIIISIITMLSALSRKEFASYNSQEAEKNKTELIEKLLL